MQDNIKTMKEADDDAKERNQPIVLPPAATNTGAPAALASTQPKDFSTNDSNVAGANFDQRTLSSTQARLPNNNITVASAGANPMPPFPAQIHGGSTQQAIVSGAPEFVASQIPPAGPILPQQNQFYLGGTTWPMMSLPLPQQSQIAPMIPNNTAAQVPALNSTQAQQGIPQTMLPILASLQQQYTNAGQVPTTTAPQGIPQMTIPILASLQQQYTASWSTLTGPPASSIPAQLSSYGTLGFLAPPAVPTDTQSQVSSSNNASIPLLGMFSFSSESRSSTSSSQAQSTSNSNALLAPDAKRRKLSTSFLDEVCNMQVFNNGNAFPSTLDSMPSSAQNATPATAHMLLANATLPSVLNSTPYSSVQNATPAAAHMLPPNTMGLQQTSHGTSMPLIMPNDKEWLTKKECFLRTHCFELFTASDDDVVSSTSGRRNPVSLGQVGIRCVYCARVPANARAQRAMCFPSSIRTMQKAFVNLVHLHFPTCNRIPESVRATYESLKSSHSPMGSNEYRIESMERILNDDGAGGVRFKDNITADNLPDAPGKIVFGSDKKFVTDFVFLLFEQMSQCVFSRCDHDHTQTDAPHELGYSGLACTCCSEVHMMGGRFFPTSPHALASMHDGGDFYAHISKCPNCPHDVKDRLLEMKEKQEDQRKELETGSKKDFFHRLWLRLHKSFNGKVYNSDKCSGRDEMECGEW